MTVLVPRDHSSDVEADWLARAGVVAAKLKATAADREDVSGQLATVRVGGGASGLWFGDAWDNVGQRLTVSGSATLNDVAVRTADVTGYGAVESAPAANLDVLYMYSGFASILTGITICALDEAAHYTRSKGRAWVESQHRSAGDDPLVFERFGQVWVQVQSATSLTDRATEAVETVRQRGDPLSRSERVDAVSVVNAARVHAGDVALNVSSRLFEVTGARSTALPHGLDRFWRNARTQSLHDPPHHKHMQLGDYLLNGTPPSPGFYS